MNDPFNRNPFAATPATPSPAQQNAGVADTMNNAFVNQSPAVMAQRTGQNLDDVRSQMFRDNGYYSNTSRVGVGGPKNKKGYQNFAINGEANPELFKAMGGAGVPAVPMPKMENGMDFGSLLNRGGIQPQPSGQPDLTAGLFERMMVGVK